MPCSYKVTIFLINLVGNIQILLLVNQVHLNLYQFFQSDSNNSPLT